MAGRRSELAAVRRHLATGSGLLLVTGEAGIGKTTLIQAATESSETFVASGHCFPMASEVPLMPGPPDAGRRRAHSDP
jgi:type II secretory pathway predicted ATPase ExeA